VFLMLIWCYWSCEIYGVCFWFESGLHAWTMMRTDIFAQATLSRLGENSRSSPCFCSNSRSSVELPFWATNHLAQARRSYPSENSWKPFVLSTRVVARARNLGEEKSHSGEKVSPKRELAEPSSALCLQSRLSESL